MGNGIPCRTFRVLEAFLLVDYVEVFSYCESIPLAFGVIKAVFAGFGVNRLFGNSLLSVKLDITSCIILVIKFVMIFAIDLFGMEMKGIEAILLRGPPVICFKVVTIVVVLVVIFNTCNVNCSSSRFVCGRFWKRYSRGGGGGDVRFNYYPTC